MGQAPPHVNRTRVPRPSSSHLETFVHVNILSQVEQGKNLPSSGSVVIIIINI